MKKTVAFICPWFGESIPGGAERAVRELLHNLMARDHDTVVLTTCARDFYHWDTFHGPGKFEENGVRGHRFALNMRDSAEFDRVNRLLLAGHPISAWDETHFLRNIVASDDLCRFIWRHRATMVSVFTPYMFGTTFWGSMISPETSFIIPCFHDEPYSRLPRYQKMLQAVQALLFYSEGEARLAEDMLGANERNRVIGLGIDLPEPVPEHVKRSFRQKFGIEAPFIYLPGRKQPEKNTQLAIDYFVHYIQNHGDSLKLVLSGPGTAEIPAEVRDTIIDLEFLDEHEMAGAYGSSRAVCIPSNRESFSFTMFEAWAHQRPVIVHRECMATALPVTQSTAGDVFSDCDSFCSAIEGFARHSDEQNLEIGKRGYIYTRDNFSWDRVIERFVEAIEQES